ncbi:NPC intracellular cholesterol transporter 2-like [Oculina patagonica]
MNAKVSVALLLLAVAAVSSKKISYQTCARSSLGHINYVDVTPCDQEPCVFRRGRKENITISFLPPDKAITEAKIYAYGIKGFLRIPLPLNHDVCQGYGLSCPLNTDLPLHLVFPVEINGKYPVPAGNYKLEVHMKDQNNDLVICGMIDLEVA